MRNNCYFQIVTSIGRNRGGLTKALYDRSIAISASGAQAIFVLPFMQVDAEDIFSEIRSAGKIPSDSILLSLYNKLSTNRGSSGAKVTHLDNFDETIKFASRTLEEHANGTTIRHFRDGVFLGASSYSVKNELVAITYHDPREPWKPIARDAFNQEGNIVSRTYLDPGFSARYRIYFSPSGHAIMSHWISPADKYYRVVVYDHNGETQQFDTMESLQISWFKECIQTHIPASIMSDEAATLSFLKLNNDVHRAKTIAAIHTTHVKDQSAKREFKSWLAEYTALQSHIDSFVLFTHAQRADFVRDGKIPPEKCYVISHPAPTSISVPAVKTGIVTVSRLDKFKRLEDSIRAFSIIAEQFSDVNYDIYGTGPEEQSLLALIKQLKLVNRVFLHGYTDRPLECFAKARLSLFTSRYEGFGLTLLESMVQCCPVISYAIEYGPIEIIEDGINGMLIENGNVQALANAIRRLLSKPNELTAMANNCSTVIDRYNSSAWKAGWANLALTLE